jgi:hypothetical protein
MVSSDDIPALERPAFFAGQRLTAADLSSAQIYNRELRWLHNRSLHGWGVASGLRVTGKAGGSVVTVQPGYAIDCTGRDLVLDSPHELTVPAISGTSAGAPATYYLTCSYAEDAQLTAETRAGACATSGAVRYPERPLIRWQDPNDADPAGLYRYGIDIVLASVRVRNCRLAEEVSGRERRDAAPPPQPYVAAGRTNPGSTAWRLWPDDNAPLGVATIVTTAEAGFQIAPRYEAQLSGERVFAPPGGSPFVVDGFPQVARATATSFELRVILPAGSTAGPPPQTTVEPADYEAGVRRFAAELGVVVISIIASPMMKLSKGATVMVTEKKPDGSTAVRPLRQVSASAVEAGLQAVADRNNILLQDLKDVNHMNSASLSLTIGDNLLLPASPARFNPPAVFQPSFTAVLQERLGWYVTWIGVEG